MFVVYRINYDDSSDFIGYVSDNEKFETFLFHCCALSDSFSNYNDEYAREINKNKSYLKSKESQKDRETSKLRVEIKELETAIRLGYEKEINAKKIKELKSKIFDIENEFIKNVIEHKYPEFCFDDWDENIVKFYRKYSEDIEARNIYIKEIDELIY